MPKVVLFALLLVGCATSDPAFVDAGADARRFDPVAFCETCKQTALLEQEKKILDEKQSQLKVKKAQLEGQITQLQLEVSSLRSLQPDGSPKGPKPYCCCVGDGTGQLVCEPNRGECLCGCPEKNCDPR